MKKVLKSFLVAVICMFSIANVFAYASTADARVKGGSMIAAQSAIVGYSKTSSAKARNDSGSTGNIIMQIWGSYKGVIYPYTVEAQTTLTKGETDSLKDTQDKDSSFKLALSPSTTKTTGYGKINLTLNPPSL